MRAALAKLGSDRGESVLLFLSGHFARNPTPAIHAAARAAQTTQIAGCTAVGVYTDEGWVIDAPAAAAMVFAPQADDDRNSNELTPSLVTSDDQWLLSLATPNGADRDWLAMPNE